MPPSAPSPAWRTPTTRPSSAPCSTLPMGSPTAPAGPTWPRPTVWTPSAALPLTSSSPPWRRPSRPTRPASPSWWRPPMENIVVPTPGCWNINDIYQPQRAGQGGQAGQKGERPVCGPQPLQVPQRQVIQALLPKRRTPDCGFAAFLPLLPRRLRPPDQGQGPSPQFFPAPAPSAKLFALETVYSYGTIFADEVML